jgi:hypothetical protein
MDARPPPAGWMPVALNLAGPAPTLDWGDFGGVRFAEPFYQQTVERWAGSAPAPLRRTGLDALAACDLASAPDPCALVFHAARCGSTLLSRLLGTVPGVRVIAEPPPLNALLLTVAAHDEAAAATLLRGLGRALGRRGDGGAGPYVLKLSSWNVLHLALFRRAFPGAALIWLQRAPASIAGSLLADPPGWLAGGAQAVFGRAPAAEGIAAFCTDALAAIFTAAAGIEGRALFLDYAELPTAAWQSVAPFLGIALAPDDLARMGNEARFHAKDPGRPFAGDDPARPDLTPAMRALLSQRVEPLYRALDRRRQGLAGPLLPINEDSGHRCFRGHTTLG